MALAPQRQRFVDEYLIDLNGAQAAIRAGYSTRRARQTAYQLLCRDDVSAAIQQAQAKRAARTEITQDRVLRELARIGFSDLRKVLTPEGALLAPGEWDDETAPAIASLEVVTAGSDDGEGRRMVERVHKIKAWDKLAALEKIAKHLGMLSGEGTGAEDAPGLTITINAAAPVGNVRVTRSDG